MHQQSDARDIASDALYATSAHRHDPSAAHCQPSVCSISNVCALSKALSVAQLGNWEVEVDDAVPPASILSGAAFLSSVPAAEPASTIARASMAKALASKPVNAAFGVRHVGAAPTAQAPAQAAPEVKPLPAGAHLLHEVAEGRPVYIDAFLVKSLRPHQLEGVRFLYNVRHAAALRCLSLLCTSRAAQRPHHCACACPSNICVRADIQCIATWCGGCSV
jgi:hypothetical protein